MQNVLFLFTNSFPYGHGESFIDNEMPYWEIFDKVVIVTLNAELPLRQKKLPQNTKCVLIPKMKGIKTISNIFKVFFRKEFYADFYNLKIRENSGLRRFRNLISFTSRGLYLASNIEDIIRKEIQKDDKIFLYSYWLNKWAYACAILSQKYDFTSISRAHRYDLYSERNNLNYLPQRAYLIDKLDGVYPISENGTEYLQSRYYSKKIKLYRLGSTDKGISPTPMIDDPNIRIVSCSWVSEVKRLDRIIEGLKLINNKGIEWVHIGDGELLEDIRQKVESLPPNIKVCFMGAFSQEQIFEYYSNTPIHYFINVSESEGIPVSIMEAISMGIPVIATDVGGNSEIVRDQYNGYLINKEFNPIELAGILQMDKYPYNIRKNARTLWDESYNADKNYPQFFSNLLSLEDEK